MKRKTAGFLLYDGVTGMDVMGPMEALGAVADILPEVGYTCVSVAMSKSAVKTETGLMILPDVPLADMPPLDYFFIPGGRGRQDIRLQHSVSHIAKGLHQQGTKIVSVCTGAFLLAGSGLLNGCRATTHWGYAQAFQQAFPAVDVVANELFIDIGDIATSAGISSGIDLTLKLIENDFGRDIATKVARYMVVHYRRAGDQAQYSEPLKFQQHSDGPFHALMPWIMSRISQTITTEEMAAFAGMSERNFHRLFLAQFATTPAKFVTALRLDYARQLLVENRWSLKQVSMACGYGRVDVFRRAFERRFGMSAKDYKARFNSHSAVLPT
ncbi:GlxA family transcriptional regulator [Aestuariibacter sp. AA17]|uniref:GlxA family transcriptional regulator n=1 Tax=Fluctibacter corallii TaxID=2984329 RepID=A0ABT3A708_9ALTE|nr:GlxA family transcriptional regulator [Aestuariibacter sp. AA17]MCV2884466.1 GlxA family transcriptional regulator [Aestuariibacter sp. AA17]